MPDYYVSLVKEYLELQGFIVKTETKYPIKEKDAKGILRTSWGDIDIIAIKVEKENKMEIWVGEVKAESQNEKGIKEISKYKFESSHVKKKLTQLFGSNVYNKFLFCWSCKPDQIEVAKNLGIKIIPFSQIIDYMLDQFEEEIVK